MDSNQLFIIAILAIGSLIVGFILYLPFHFLLKYLRRRSPQSSKMRISITGRGILVYATLVCTMVIAVAQEHLAPDTWFGQFMSTVGGQFLFMFGLVFVLGIIENLLKARGWVLWTTPGTEAEKPNP